MGADGRLFFVLYDYENGRILSVLVTSEPDELSVQDSLSGARVQRCGSPVATSKGRRYFEAPTEPTGETAAF